MYDTNFKLFKLRYFILLFIMLSIVVTGATIALDGGVLAGDAMQLLLSTGLTLYLLWQMKVKNIRFNSTPLNSALHTGGWGKYVGATIAVKLYAQLLTAVFGVALVVLLFDFLHTVLDFITDVPLEAVDTPALHYVLLFITICILAPIWEELFFRGIVMRRLLTKWHAPASLIVSSLIFGLFHINPVQIVYASILGLLLGYAYLRTENIIVPMILHAIANGTSFIFIVAAGGQTVDSSVITQFLDIDKADLQQSLLYLLIITIIATAILVFVFMKNYRHLKNVAKIDPSAEQTPHENPFSQDI